MRLTRRNARHRRYSFAGKLLACAIATFTVSVVTTGSVAQDEDDIFETNVADDDNPPPRARRALTRGEDYDNHVTPYDRYYDDYYVGDDDDGEDDIIDAGPYPVREWRRPEPKQEVNSGHANYGYGGYYTDGWDDNRGQFNRWYGN